MASHTILCDKNARAPSYEYHLEEPRTTNVFANDIAECRSLSLVSVIYVGVDSSVGRSLAMRSCRSV